MMRNKLVIQTVGNGFVIDFGNATATPSVDEFTRVAVDPDHLAEIVKQWATTEVVLPAATGRMVLADTDPHRIRKMTKMTHEAAIEAFDPSKGLHGGLEQAEVELPPEVGVPVKFRKVPRAFSRLGTDEEQP